MWHIVGQTRAVSLLQRALETESLAHAYLFIGPAHVGKMTLAVNLAQVLNCEAAERPCGNCSSCKRIASSSHADVQIIGLTQNANSSEAKIRAEIGIEQIRQMQHAASLPPFEGSYKVFIIDSAEFMSNEAANCLLKTLEEPVGRVVIILLTVCDSLLPSTVVSRCQRLELHPLTAAEIEFSLDSRWGIEPGRAKLLARLSHGCLGWALSAAFDDSLLRQREEEIGKLLGIITADYEERFAQVAQLAVKFVQNRERVYEVLDLWLDYWRDLLLVKMDCSNIIINIDRLTTLVEMSQNYKLSQIKAFIDSIRAAGEQLRQNTNPRLVLEVLMLDMPGKEGGSGEILTTGSSVKYG